jgi:nucleotide-binding universal stress UspA family protein
LLAYSVTTFTLERDMFEKILVPLDGSPLAEGILSHVRVLAKGLDSRVIVLHAVEAFPVDHLDPELEPYAARAVELIHPLAESYVERIARNLVHDGVDAQMRLVRGRAAEEIVGYAEGEDVGLIAMSTRGRSGPARWVLGSTADKVLRSVECPLLLVHPPDEGIVGAAIGKLSRIVVPLDGSPTAESVLTFVEELARALELEITLVQAIGIETTVQFGRMTPDTRPVLNDVLQRMAASASDYLAGIAKELERGGLSVQWEVLGGPPAQRVVDFAREAPDCLVAMTTHGRSGFRRWAMGSVADQVVRRIGEPVLLVRALSGG